MNTILPDIIFLYGPAGCGKGTQSYYLLQIFRSFSSLLSARVENNQNRTKRATMWRVSTVAFWHKLCNSVHSSSRRNMNDKLWLRQIGCERYRVLWNHSLPNNKLDSKTNWIEDFAIGWWQVEVYDKSWTWFTWSSVAMYNKLPCT